MGTLLLAGRAGLPPCLEELNLSAPDEIRNAHREYVLAGAEIIQTNTFGANRVRLSAPGLSGRVEEVNRAAVALAREAAGPEVLVAGSVGPLGRRIVEDASAGQPDEIPHAAAREAFGEQMAALAGACVDLIVLETFSHVEELGEALAAHDAGARGIPLVVQVTVNTEGTLGDGATIEGLLRFLNPWRPAAIGCNCSQGPASVRSAIEVLVARANCSVSAQPSAGLPRRQGEQLVYPWAAKDFGHWAAWAIESGVRIVGGCCGTTPDHIRAVRAAADEWRSRPRSSAAPVFTLNWNEASR
jgi:homocysteine S-methyltransferase